MGEYTYPMNNLTSAVKALKETKRLKEIFITVRVAVDSLSSSDLEAVGERDLEEHFIPKALYLRPGDTVKVRFSY